MFQITRHIWQGPFASQKRLNLLQKSGISHIINVGESPNQLMGRDGPFQKVIWYPVEDLIIIPTGSALDCLQKIHDCLCVCESNLYIHCVAGWNRSPTLLWLYFIACGIDPEIGKRMIFTANYDAIPGHPKLVNDSLVTVVREYGKKAFNPHPRPFALEPINKIL